MNYNKQKPSPHRVPSQIVCVQRITGPHMLLRRGTRPSLGSPNPASVAPVHVDTIHPCYNERDGQIAESRSASMYDLSAVAQGYQWGTGAGM